MTMRRVGILVLVFISLAGALAVQADDNQGVPSCDGQCQANHCACTAAPQGYYLCHWECACGSSCSQSCDYCRV